MTKIEWTQRPGTKGETWNPVVGCSVVSPGCTNCYAMRMARRLAANPATPHYAGTVQTVNGNPVWTGKVAAAPEAILTKPLRWREPRTVFVNSMGDLFHEDVPEAWIDRVFTVMAETPQHKYQLLTKRPERMRDYVNAVVNDAQRFTKWAARAAPIARSLGRARKVPPRWPLPNVWLGTSVEDAARLARVAHLRRTPAALRFLSLEPLLGPLDGLDLTGIDWVIAGGESGPGARPMHPDWPRALRDQCVAAGVPFFFKQHGEWLGTYPTDPKPFGDVACHNWNGGRSAWRVGKKAAGKVLDGWIWDQFPEAAA